MVGLILFFQINIPINNPSFENWIDSTTPEDWIVEHPQALPVLQEEDTVFDGIYSVKIKRASKTTSYTSALLQWVPVDYPGYLYKIEFYIFDNDTNVRGRIYCTWCDADSNSLGNSFASSYSQNSPDWQMLVAEEEAPTDAALIKLTLRIYLEPNSSDSTGVLFYDALNGLEIKENKINMSFIPDKNSKLFRAYDILGRKNKKGKIVFIKTEKGITHKIIRIRK